MEMPRVESDKERELIARAQAGDRAAFSALVREHGNEVYTLARRLVGDPHLAADVAQEALIRAWRALEGQAPGVLPPRTMDLGQT